VPVLSWLVLRGKCRDCAEPISTRYPLVELGTGVAFAAVTGWWFVMGGVASTSSATAVVASILVIIAFL
jgi:leader peptidase (prepilin peptidase)/N-methyltransferase